MFDFLRYKLFELDKKSTTLKKGFFEWFCTQPTISILAPTLLKIWPGYSQSLVFSCMNSARFDSLKHELNNYIKARHAQIKNWKVIRRAAGQALFLGDSSLAKEIIDQAKLRNIHLPKAIMKRVDLIDQNIDGYIESYRYSPKKNQIKKFYPDKYVEEGDIEDVLYSNKKIVILTTLGPGDEACFSFFYSALINDQRVKKENITIIGDHRFTNIYSRTYPELKFVGSRRAREISKTHPYNLYSKLPSFKLHRLLCNESEKAILAADKVLFNLDLLWTYRAHLNSKNSSRTFKADPSVQKEIKKHFHSSQKYIGLSWRSGINTSIRNEYYLNIKELEPLFQLEGVTFVNLQYDDCSEELEWAEKHYPGKIISLPNVDLFNDFEHLLCIFQSLSAVVTSPTIVAEFAALAGCKVFLMSNVEEIAARTMPNGQDLWNHNITCIKGDQYSDRKSLVANIIKQIEK